MQDGIGEFSSNENDEKKYWISFLNGMQRILLITTDEYILKEIEAIGDFEQIQQEIALSLEGIGFSLVNNVFKKELLYISISRYLYAYSIQRHYFKCFCKDYSNSIYRINYFSALVLFGKRKRNWGNVSSQ